MRRYFRIGCLFILCLGPATSFAGQKPAGTKGQNYDRILFEMDTDDEVEIVAKIMTINRYPTSSSSIVVTDNGVTAFGPASDAAERWTRTISIKGRGRHDIVLICSNANSDPVFCALSTSDARASLLD